MAYAIFSDYDNRSVDEQRSIFSCYVENVVARFNPKIILYTIACIGILFVLRGLGLGIPYVSPSDMSLFFKAVS